VGFSKIASNPPEKPKKPNPNRMPINEDSFSFVKYLYTIDSNMTSKNATAPYIMPLRSPERLSTTTADKVVTSSPIGV
jgi:hypothetical protein